jgi:hypothetical protein
MKQRSVLSQVLGVMLVAVMLASPVVAFAQARQVIFESVTVANTAIGLTAATYTPRSGSSQVVRCTMRLETAQVRFRYDGTNPTSSEGTLLEVGEVLTLSGFDFLEDFRAIRTGATSGVLKVACES